IPPIILTDEDIEEIQKTVPFLPPYYRENWKVLNLDSSVTNTILNSTELAHLFDSIYPLKANKEEVFKEFDVDEEKYKILVKRIFNWFASTPIEDIDISKIEEGYFGPRKLLQ